MNEIYVGITMDDEKRQIIFKNLYKESLEEIERSDKIQNENDVERFLNFIKENYHSHSIKIKERTSKNTYIMKLNYYLDIIASIHLNGLELVEEDSVRYGKFKLLYDEAKKDTKYLFKVLNREMFNSAKNVTIIDIKVKEDNDVNVNSSFKARLGLDIYYKFKVLETDCLIFKNNKNQENEEYIKGECWLKDLAHGPVSIQSLLQHNILTGINLPNSVTKSELLNSDELEYINKNVPISTNGMTCALYEENVAAGRAWWDNGEKYKIYIVVHDL